MQNLFFNLDKDRSCWFIHAISGSKKSFFLLVLVALFKVRNQNMLGDSYRLWLVPLFFFSLEHILYCSEYIIPPQ